MEDIWFDRLEEKKSGLMEGEKDLHVRIYRIWACVINGYGSWFYKSCHYQCDGMYNKRVYRVDPDYYCPRSFREA